MRVVSRLVETEIKIQSVQREGEALVVLSDPSVSLPTKIYLTPEDIVQVLRAMLSPGVVGYLLRLPFLYLRR